MTMTAAPGSDAAAVASAARLRIDARLTKTALAAVFIALKSRVKLGVVGRVVSRAPIVP